MTVTHHPVGFPYEFSHIDHDPVCPVYVKSQGRVLMETQLTDHYLETAVK